MLWTVAVVLVILWLLGLLGGIGGELIHALLVIALVVVVVNVLSGRRSHLRRREPIADPHAHTSTLDGQSWCGRTTWSYTIGFPAAGPWKLRLNSDWQGYSEDFAGHPSGEVLSEPGEYDGFPFHAPVSIGPYSVLIFSQ
jgi:hypothetical protein